MNRNPRRAAPQRALAAAALALLLAACTSVQQQSRALIEQGDYRGALARLDQGMRERPADPELRMQYMRVRDQLAARQIAEAAAEFNAGRLEAAATLFRQVLELDAGNARAAAGLAAIDMARRHQALAEDAAAQLDKGQVASAELLVKGVLAENPQHALARELDRRVRERERARAMESPALRSRLSGPVNLEFRDAPLRQVIEALSRSAGINFLIDRELRPDARASISVRNVRVEDAIDLLLINNQLEKKVLTENTILIYPSTPGKLREHQELVMRTFQLGNADAKQAVNLLRTMLKTKDLYVDERTNMIVMRDTPDVVRAAERLIAAHDMADPEVVLELEILEVSRTKVRDLGLTYPSEFSGPFGRLSQIGDLARDNIGVDTGFKLKLLRTDGETKTLANPRVRVRHREKARVHIGDRVPVISSTIIGTTAGGGAGSQPVTTEQIQYLDVGIKIEAEANIHPDDTVAVRISLDVSSLGAQTKTNAGTTAYEVGTRNAVTVLRLRDGETQALMGLIRDDDVQSSQGLPFIGEGPVLDRIFGSKRTDRRSRELILLITPQLVRGFRPPDATLAEFWSGTEAALRLRSPFVQTVAADGAARAPGPGGAAAGAPAPAAAAPAAALAAPAVAAIAAPAVQAPSALSWAAPGSMARGQESVITLRARSEAALKGASFQLRYDPGQIEIVAVEEGDFFGRGGKTVFTQRIDARLGLVLATIGAEDAPAAGDAPLLSLRVKPRLGGGKARLQLSSATGLDAAGQAVPLSGAEVLELTVVP